LFIINTRVKYLDPKHRTTMGLLNYMGPVMLVGSHAGRHRGDLQLRTVDFWTIGRQAGLDKARY